MGLCSEQLNLGLPPFTHMSTGGLGSVTYDCMRCGTGVTIEELSTLPEIKCICGFRVFRKARQPVVKQIKAI